MSRAIAAGWLVLSLAAPLWAQQGSQVLVIVGLGGDHENADRFHQWAVAIVDAARDQFAIPGESIVYLGEDPSRDPKRMSGRSTREAIVEAINRMAARARPGDRVFIVLIGHGASATGVARVNVPGPDLTAADFARLLARLSAQQVVFVNTASASGGFIAALAGKNRVVIAATQNEGERNQTRFGEYFADALSNVESDSDKDGRISMLEAFVAARRRVVESYERDGQLLTEHAVLDDNGDGLGSDRPGQPGGDGALARTLFMTAGAPDRDAVAGADPELRSLVERRLDLETRIATLKGVRAKTSPEQYEHDMEQLLIELARTNRAIRERQKQ